MYRSWSSLLLLNRHGRCRLQRSRRCGLRCRRRSRPLAGELVDHLVGTHEAEILPGEAFQVALVGLQRLDLPPEPLVFRLQVVRLLLQLLLFLFHVVDAQKSPVTEDGEIQDEQNHPGGKCIHPLAHTGSPLQVRCEIVDGPFQAVFHRHGGGPAEPLPGQGDVRLTLFGVVRRQRPVNDPRGGAGEPHDPFGELADGGLRRVPQVDRADEPVALHHPHHPLHEVGDEAEGAGLGTVAVHRDLLPFQRLHDEVGDDPAVVLRHARAVGLEDPDDPDIHAVLPVVVHHQGLGHPFPFIIAAPDADGVHVPPVRLRLRVHLGVAVHLGGGRLQDPRADPFREPEHIDGPQDARLDGLHRVVLVVDRRGGAGQVVDPVHLQEDRFRDVVAHQFEPVVVHEVDDVVLAAGEEVVQADDVVPLPEEPFAEVGTDEAGAAGDENAHAISPPRRSRGRCAPAEDSGSRPGPSGPGGTGCGRPPPAVP